MGINFNDYPLTTNVNWTDQVIINQNGTIRKCSVEDLLGLPGHTSTSSTTTTSSFSTASTLSTTTSSFSTASTVSTTTSSFSTQSTQSTQSTTTSSFSTQSTTTSSFSTQSTTTSGTTVTTESTTTTSGSTVTTQSTTTTSGSTVTTESTLTTTTTTSLSSTTTTTRPPCAYDDAFTNVDDWELETRHAGTETFTPVAGRIRLTLPDADSAIRVYYRHQIPTGNFDIRIDFSTYSAIDVTNAIDAVLRIQDGIGANRAVINYTLNADGATHEITSNLRCNNENQFSSTINPATRPTILRITRVGNIFSAYYYLAGWQLIDTRNYGNLAAYVTEIALEAIDNGNRGGYAEFDDLTFVEGCPNGTDVAWTSTSSTTTTSMSSTSTFSTVSTTTTTEPPLGE